MFSVYNKAMYKVIVSQKAAKGIKNLPKGAKDVFFSLLADIQASGPVQPDYANYSKLGNFTYHCHLSYQWVACWRNEAGSIIVEVYYVGSRENAPY